MKRILAGLLVVGVLLGTMATEVKAGEGCETCLNRKAVLAGHHSHDGGKTFSGGH